ncbi:hypothetical protein F4802DRAFT_601874 [Xylaria palmicola]|nr:hypothetical protein F4802DRAFT_601874 [Xylaria palmicola]
MGGSDVESLLENGFWPNSRAKSPDPRSIPDSLQRPSHSTEDAQAVPRKMPYHIGLRKPPPPIVEDENDALAKEAGSVASSVPSEEPPNRGDPDQYPILLPVEEDAHKHNPERRFILVPNPTDASSDVSGSEKKPSERERRRSAERAAELDPEPAFYEANTGRKYESPPDRDDKPTRKEARPETEHRRNRPGDLPPIITDSRSEGRPYSDARRGKSTTRVDSRGEDYFSPRLSSVTSQGRREHLLTPEVIEHATHGRDRPIYRGGSSPEPQGRNPSARSNDRHSRNNQDDRRHKEREYRSARASSPTLQKRRTSEVPKFSRRGSKESRESSRRYADRSPSKSDRQVPSSTPSQSDFDSSSQQSSTSGDSRAPVRYNDTFYSSEDEPQRHVDPRRRRPTTPTKKREYLATPVESRGASRRTSRGQSTLPSPRRSQNSFADPSSTSSGSRSATFPREPIPPREDDRSGRPPPRASTARGSFTATRNAAPAPAAAAAVSASAPNGSVDPRRPTALPPPRAFPRVESRPLPPTPSVAVPTQPTWPPPRFEPPQQNIPSSPPISTYRRFSTEVKTGELPDIPHCPRTRPEAGHMDWLTLPRCDSFNICPSCYGANFKGTEFAHEFVVMPFRPLDRPLACDFGSSEFYRIAWLFTRKYRRPDLGLLHGLAKLAAQCQPCVGAREASRIWYSVRDPATRRPVEGFAACDACATAVETLLPGLTGLFVPVAAPAERARGVCALHHDRGHDRGRFLLYFDALEGAADQALATQSAPDVQALAARVRQIAAVPPCPGDRAVAGAHWHVMRDVPLVVCPECFALVVQPLLDGREDYTVAGNFLHAPKPLPRATCMLYSDNMRALFNRAAAGREMDMLAAVLKKREGKKAEFEERLAMVHRMRPGSKGFDDEMRRILREWRRYE